MNQLTRDMELIADTVDRYFRGMYESNGDVLRSSFEPTALITGHTEGRFAAMDVDQFVAFAEKQPSAKAAGEPFDMRIVSVDITGQAAVVKVADRYIGRDFVDYLSLLKKDGAWLIINKLWEGGPQT